MSYKAQLWGFLAKSNGMMKFLIAVGLLTEAGLKTGVLIHTLTPNLRHVANLR